MKTGKDRKRLWTVLATAGVLSVVSGCGFKTDRSRWLSPEKVIKSPEGPAPVRAIDRNIGVADQDQARIAGSTLPRSEDFEYSAEDYQIGPGDVLDVSILDLFNEGLETVLRRQVSGSGYIDLPLLPDRIKATDRTQEQLKDDIIDAYSPDILLGPTVSVTVVAQRQNTFSILGAVARTGQYNVVRRSMRLLEAIALAGGITGSNIEYLYVIRQRPPRLRPAKDAVKGAGDGGGKLPPLPKVPTTKPAGDTSKAGNDKAAPAGGREQTLLPAPRPALMLAETDASAPGGATPAPAPKSEYDWVFSTRSGRWIRARKGGAGKGADGVGPDAAGADDPFKWAPGDDAEAVRIIAIDLKKLRSGDPRMNIVVQDKDIINVPPLELGEFYVMGEVQRPGVYSLTGRQITVKMAIAAAGNLGPMAWPENAVLIRRVGSASEQMVPLNIERIFRGEQNDLFLKPNDVIAVGTDIRAPFLAVLRNAFRLTYGFGFIYDRNFGATSSYTTERDSRRFSRW